MDLIDCSRKMCMYEESARTPVYIKFPKGYSCSKKKYDQYISSIDIFPTICEFLGLHPVHKVDGESLMPILTGQKQELDRKELYIQFDGNGARSNFQRCVMKDGYKLSQIFLRMKLIWNFIRWKKIHMRQKILYLIQI